MLSPPEDSATHRSVRSDGGSHRTAQIDGLNLHLAEDGPAEGPVVLLLHGFPECWYSWRHQLAGLAAAGFRAVAPDQRGYGRSDAPADAGAYTVPHLVGDAVGVLDAVGAEQAVVVGHDWGAPVAWHAALLRPDRVRGVVALSVPYRPRSSVPPTAALRKRFGPGFYQLYFQEPGVADAELAADPAATFRRLFAATSGGGPAASLTVAAGGGFLDRMPEPAALPGWLTDDDLAVYVEEYRERGFTGGLNWYRCLDRTWELTGAWRGARVTVPAAFLAGEGDIVVAGRPFDALGTDLRAAAPALRTVTRLPGCGHWTQQERPDEVTAAIVALARETADAA